MARVRAAEGRHQCRWRQAGASRAARYALSLGRQEGAPRVARSANVKQQPREGLSEELKRRLREAGALLLLPLALYLLVCLFSYNPHDPSWTNAGQLEHARNFGGTVGAYIA